MRLFPREQQIESRIREDVPGICTESTGTPDPPHTEHQGIRDSVPQRGFWSQPLAGNRGTPHSIWDRKRQDAPGILAEATDSASLTPPCFAQTVVASHFNATPANVPTRAVQGRRRCACTRRRSSIPTASRSLPTFSGGGSWAEPLWKTAHRWIPMEGVQFGASPS